MEARESGSGPWLAVVGSTMIDQIAYAERMPERGETVIGDRFAQGFGGKGELLVDNFYANFSKAPLAIEAEPRWHGGELSSLDLLPGYGGQVS